MLSAQAQGGDSGLFLSNTVNLNLFQVLMSIGEILK